ncbi:hypothetical protein R1sor_000117 [Riccia sorocarpa]|uniref:Uncharacterized protein n=1 Tax=Riccia sorocarpa TaxID=122646 RepID=A0ABD3GS68_9MARC
MTQVRVVNDSQEELPMDNPDEADPEENTGDVAQDSEDSDPEVLDEAGRTLAVPDPLDLWHEQKHQLQDDLLCNGRPLVVYMDFQFDNSISGFHVHCR